MSRRKCKIETNKIESYQPARNAIDSAKRWISKANQNSDKTLNSEIDKFFSLFVSYNILYSLISDKNNGDRCSAVTVISNYIKDNNIPSFTQHHIDILKMIQPIREHDIFHIYNAKKDFKLIKNIDDKKDFEESVLDILYGIRCNMFHGEKELIEDQLLLLSPANKILNTLLSDLITSITKEWSS
jgi:hypothetical protein